MLAFAPLAALVLLASSFAAAAGDRPNPRILGLDKRLPGADPAPADVNLGGHALEPRQAGTQPSVAPGTSNPPVSSHDPITFDAVEADGGEAAGDLSIVGSGNHKRQTGTQPVEVIGTSNPAPAADELNNLGDTTALVADANGAMSNFARSLSSPSSSSKLRRSPHPIPEPDQLNRISHLVATRGRADGTIELIQV
ncbi:hypothetical protein JCM1841_004143 [Sporobolomyces salmonicolor]